MITLTSMGHGRGWVKVFEALAAESPYSMALIDSSIRARITPLAVLGAALL